MNKINLILHAHLPYVRHLEYPKFLEENWLFESLNETYIPLLRMLEKLDRENVPFQLAMCFSPTLSTMLTDAPLQERFIDYMNLRIELGEKEVERTGREEREAYPMAVRYLSECRENLFFFESCKGNILTGYRHLADKGHIELLTTAATHAFLPVFKSYPNAVKAQIIEGLHTHRRIFGQTSKGFWLPDCGYYPGLDDILSACGVSWIQLPSHAVVSAKDKSKYGGFKPVELPSKVMGFARNWNITSLVWSNTYGYPCDSDYRDFYRDIGYSLPMSYVRPYIHEPEIRTFTGYKYHAITGKTNNKRYYDYDKAMPKVQLHVENFLYNIKRYGMSAEASGVSGPVFNLAYDAELFGHRWYEGMKFLELLLRLGTKSPEFMFTTPSSVILENGKTDRIRPNECSWVPGGYSDTFLDSSNAWIYRHLYKAIERMGELSRRFPDQGTLKDRFLNQASRELLLAMSSDWPCIMHDNTSVAYAKKRLENHLGSFNVVYASMCKNTVNTEWLVNAERRNDIFPDIDYRLFSEN